MQGIESKDGLILGYTPEEVASQPDQIIPGTTRAYMGSLVHRDGEGKIIPIFNRLQGIEIYASPDRKIRRQSLEIDGRLAGKSTDQVIGEFNKVGINVSDLAKDLLRGTKFTGNPRVVELIWLTDYDLGFKDVTTTRDMFKRGAALGLERCEGEVGLYQRFAEKDQLINTKYSIVMDPITGSSGDLGVFILECREDGLWLRSRWAYPRDWWSLEAQFVWCLPQGYS